MQSLTFSCPCCRVRFAVAPPTPERITCPGCRTTFPIQPAAPAGAVATGMPPAPLVTVMPAPVANRSALPGPVPPRGRTGPLLLVGGAGVLLVGLIMGVILLSRDVSPTETKADDDLTARIARKPPPPPDPRIKIVRPAVDRGVAYLKASVPKLKGLRAGYLGLNGLALLEGGVRPDDPAILSIVELIRGAAPGMNQTYDLASALFFLNRWDEGRPLNEGDRKMARTFALRIIAGQLQTGIWGYGGVVMAPAQEAKLLAALQQGTYKPAGVATPSMSNTQFAMLAIWGARKHGVPVREPLLALAAYFHANQHPDGHWHYPANSLAATSTCAGLIALAIEMALLQDREFVAKPHEPDRTKKRADVAKAFAFVAKTIGRKKTDPGAGTTLGYGGALFDADAIGDLYFLWTLERVGVIYSKELIGGKNWYDWGYPIVMQAQQADGSWNERHRLSFGPLIDTPFALLFLMRANIAKDLTDKLRELERGLGVSRGPAAPVPVGPGRARA